MTTSAYSHHATLLGRFHLEINLVVRQIERAREVRNASISTCKSRININIGPKSLVSSPDVAPSQSSTAAALHEVAPVSSAVAHPLLPVDPSYSLRKEGALLHLVKGVFGGEKFVPHFIVVEEEKGILWYHDEEHRRSTPHNPLGHVPFWKVAGNSRGSCFRKAAVCWPLILPEDCPKANDPTKTYFAVEYLNDKNIHAKQIFAASSQEERNNWVFFLTQYIEMFLVSRPESVELQGLPRGAEVPRYVSEVIDGEAPGGSIV